jgi:hypothetical protein
MIVMESNPRFPPRFSLLTHGSSFLVRLLREPLKEVSIAYFRFVEHKFSLLLESILVLQSI